MSDLREAAEMALEALENSTDFIPVKTGLKRETNNAIQALRQALEEKHWVKTYCGGKPNYVDAVNMRQDCVDETGKSEHKREWVGLDEVEVTGMTCECVDDGTFNMSCAHDFARAIEAKLRERNT